VAGIALALAQEEELEQDLAIVLLEVAAAQQGSAAAAI